MHAVGGHETASGSHIVMRRDRPFAQAVIPAHRSIDTGTLARIVAGAGRGAIEQLDEFIPRLRRLRDCLTCKSDEGTTRVDARVPASRDRRSSETLWAKHDAQMDGTPVAVGQQIEVRYSEVHDASPGRRRNASSTSAGA